MYFVKLFLISLLFNWFLRNWLSVPVLDAGSLTVSAPLKVSGSHGEQRSGQFHAHNFSNTVSGI
jgi:hypothetical protein